MQCGAVNMAHYVPQCRQALLRCLAHYTMCDATCCARTWNILCQNVEHTVPERKTHCIRTWKILCQNVEHSVTNKQDILIRFFTTYWRTWTEHTQMVSGT
jgi:hypothetical protein